MLYWVNVKMIKAFTLIEVVVAIFIVTGVVYNLFYLKSDLQKEVRQLRGEAEILEEENRGLLRNIEYFKNKDNLLKELKSQFNYREAGESIIIIVPEASSTPR